MALQTHLQASASAARQAHGQNVHGACHKPQLHPYHWEWNMQQVTMPQKQKYAYADNLAFMHSAGDW